MRENESRHVIAMKNTTGIKMGSALEKTSANGIFLSSADVFLYWRSKMTTSLFEHSLPHKDRLFSADIRSEVDNHRDIIINLVRYEFLGI